MFIKHINQLRESRRYKNAFIIFNAFQPLPQNLFYYHCIFFQIFIVRLQIKEDSDKRRLSVCCHQSINLVLNCLHTAAQLILQTSFCKALYNFISNTVTDLSFDRQFEFFIAAAQIFA